MGDYIRKEGNAIIKTSGGLFDTVFSRIQMLEFQREGYRGFYNGEYTDELEKLLSDPNTIYGFDNLIENNKHYKWIETYDFKLPNTVKSHNPIHIFHNGYQYKVDCKEKDNSIINAKLVGERFIDGQYQSVFACKCCGALFGISHTFAMLYRHVFPEAMRPHKHIISSIECFDDLIDLDLAETLELLVEQYSYKDFYALVGSDETEEKLKAKGYLTLYSFYNKNIKYSSIGKLAGCKMTGNLVNAELVEQLRHAKHVWNKEQYVKTIEESGLDEAFLDEVLRANGIASWDNLD
jgi:hypothetical protein